MNPFEFLTLAQSLSKVANSEASSRTSISRSYYSIFNFIKDELSGNGIVISQGSNAHGELRIFLANSGVSEAEDLSSLVGDLYGHRITADYKMKSEVTQKTAETVLLKASEIWTTFKKIDKGILAQGIQNFKAKNNYT